MQRIVHCRTTAAPHKSWFISLASIVMTLAILIGHANAAEEYPPTDPTTPQQASLPLHSIIGKLYIQHIKQQATIISHLDTETAMSKPLKAWVFNLAEGVSLAVTDWSIVTAWLQDQQQTVLSLNSPILYNAVFDLEANIIPIADIPLDMPSSYQLRKAFVAKEGQDMTQTPPEVAYVVMEQKEYLFILRYKLDPRSLQSPQCTPLPPLQSNDPNEILAQVDAATDSWIICLQTYISDDPTMHHIANKLRHLIGGLVWVPTRNKLRQ